MFKIKNYTDLQIGNAIYSDQTVTIPVNRTINDEKIEKDIKKMKKMLLNLRELYGKDFILTVTENNIKLEVN